MGSDMMDPHCEGIHGDRQCQVCSNKQRFVDAYPILSGKEKHVDQALKNFLRDYGVPDTMTMDGSKEQTARGSEFEDRRRKTHITPVITLPQRPNNNPREVVIRDLQKRWFRMMYKTNFP